MSWLDTVKSERGFTLIEIVVSMILLSVLTVVAYGIIQSSDKMMRFGSKRAHVAQATRSGVEHLKEKMHRGSVPAECDSGATGHFVLNTTYEVTFTCEGGQKSISRLYKVTVHIKESSSQEIVGDHIFYALKGGY